MLPLAERQWRTSRAPQISYFGAPQISFSVLVPSIGLVEVKPSTTYTEADVYIVAHQAKQVYYLPYPCQKENLKGWEVVFRVSPHGKLPMPSADDYNNIDPKTYEGIFYQEQEDLGTLT